MNYYKAKEQDTLPNLTWDLVATSVEELTALGLEADPLVVEEPRLLDPLDPNYISYEFGICHLRVQDGALVPTLPAVITAAQTQRSKALNVVKTRENEAQIESAVFTFDGNTFPLNNGAFKVYQAVYDLAPESTTIASLEGNYNLLAAKMAGFKAAMNSAILGINVGTITQMP